MKGLVRTLLVAAVALSVGAQAGLGQQTHQLVVNRGPGDPVVLVKGDYDQMAKDWLRDLALTVKNTQEKPVYGVDVDLSLITGRGDIKPFVVTAQFGKPEVLKTNVASPKDPCLKADKTTVLKLSGQELRRLYDFLRETGIPYPSGVMVKVRTVYFGDGSAWQSGRMVALGGSSELATKRE
jgi:hypothetical protein